MFLTYLLLKEINLGLNIVKMEKVKKVYGKNYMKL